MTTPATTFDIDKAPGQAITANATSVVSGHTVTLSVHGLADNAPGTVTFTNVADGSTLCTVTLPDIACTVAGLPVGTYRADVAYSGDATHAPTSTARYHGDKTYLGTSQAFPLSVVAAAGSVVPPEHTGKPWAGSLYWILLAVIAGAGSLLLFGRRRARDA